MPTMILAPQTPKSWLGVQVSDCMITSTRANASLICQILIFASPQEHQTIPHSFAEYWKLALRSLSHALPSPSSFTLLPMQKMHQSKLKTFSYKRCINPNWGHHLQVQKFYLAKRWNSYKQIKAQAFNLNYLFHVILTPILNYTVQDLDIGMAPKHWRTA